MQSTYNLPDTLQEDLERFEEEVARFKQGAVGGAEFRAFRVPQGVYEERTEGSYMLRVRFPAGGLLPAQMRALASVARTYGNGVLHLTTRQDVQVHAVPLDNIHPALTALAEAGLSTKGGGGNTVRNIIACSDAGVCAQEEFDVAPYAVALTEFMLPDPLSYRMPRKYKIAFSGCPADCAGAMVNDLALFARVRDGQRGFAVYVAGGMGANCRVAEPLEEFVPAEEIHYVAEAVKHVFDKHGNRKNKHKARLRYLMADVGPEAFHRLYEEELAALRSEGLPPLQVRDLPRRQPEPPEAAAEPARELRRMARPQRDRPEARRLLHGPRAARARRHRRPGHGRPGGRGRGARRGGRAHDAAPERAAAVGARQRAARPAPRADGRRPGRLGRAHRPQHDLLRRRRHLQARHLPLARALARHRHEAPEVRHRPGRPRRDERPDQRLPELLRPPPARPHRPLRRGAPHRRAARPALRRAARRAARRGPHAPGRGASHDSRPQRARPRRRPAARVPGIRELPGLRRLRRRRGRRRDGRALRALRPRAAPSRTTRTSTTTGARRRRSRWPGAGRASAAPASST